MERPDEVQKLLAISQYGQLKLLIGVLRRAIRQPSSVSYRLDCIRLLLLLPIIVDVVVTIAQFRGLKRVKAIKTPIPEIQHDLDNDEVLKAN